MILRRLRDLLTITFLLGTIGVVSVLTIFQSKQDFRALEKLERRDLHERPASPSSFSELKSYPSHFEDHIADTFGGRASFVKLYQELLYRFFSITPGGRMLVGKDGWFFRGKGQERVEGELVKPFDNVADLLGFTQMTEKELVAWRIALEERQKYLGQRGMKYIFFVAPRKSHIYPEFLPSEFDGRIRMGRSEQLTRYLQEHSDIAVVDLISCLKQAKKEMGELPLYLKTDAHWNTLGALAASQCLVEELRKQFPNKTFEDLRLDQFALRWKKWSHAGFSSQMGFRVNEAYPYLVPTDGTLFQNFSLYTNKQTLWQAPFETSNEELSGLHFKKHNIRLGLTRFAYRSFDDSKNKARRFTYIVNRSATPLKALYMQGDSFGEKMLYYLATTANETFYRRNVLRFSTDLFEHRRPEVVLQEISAGYISGESPFPIGSD